MLPFSEIKNRAALDAQVSVGSSTEMNKISNAIKRAYKKIWQSTLWTESMIIDREHTLSSGSNELLIDKDISAIFTITENSLKEVLEPSFVHVWALDHIVSKASTGSPRKFTKADIRGLAVAPSANTQIYLSSSSSSDSFNCRVIGRDTSGNYLSQQVTLNGTSSISTTGTFNKDYPIFVNKGKLSVGTITVKDASGNTLDTIAPREYTNRYDVVNFAKSADKDYTLFVAGKKRFIPLEYDEDMPLVDCADALILYGVAAIYQDRKDFDRANQKIVEANMLLEALATEKFIHDIQREDTNMIMAISEDDMPMLEMF